MFSIIPRSVLCNTPRAPSRFCTAMIKLLNAKNSRTYMQPSVHSKDADRKSSSPSEADRIHVLGIGNIGLFFAHSLARELNPPPITLLLHRPELLHDWEKNGRSISLIREGKPVVASGFDIELVVPPEAEHPQVCLNFIYECS